MPSRGMAVGPAPQYLRISTPVNLDLALEGLVRKVLREQPKQEDIYSFAADYFETLLAIRDRAEVPDSKINEICPDRSEAEASELIKLATSFAKPAFLLTASAAAVKAVASVDKPAASSEDEPAASGGEVAREDADASTAEFEATEASISAEGAEENSTASDQGKPELPSSAAEDELCQVVDIDHIPKKSGSSDALAQVQADEELPQKDEEEAENEGESSDKKRENEENNLEESPEEEHVSATVTDENKEAEANEPEKVDTVVDNKVLTAETSPLTENDDSAEGNNKQEENDSVNKAAENEEAEAENLNKSEAQNDEPEDNVPKDSLDSARDLGPEVGEAVTDSNNEVTDSENPTSLTEHLEAVEDKANEVEGESKSISEQVQDEAAVNDEEGTKIEGELDETIGVPDENVIANGKTENNEEADENQKLPENEDESDVVIKSEAGSEQESDVNSALIQSEANDVKIGGDEPPSGDLIAAESGEVPKSEGTEEAERDIIKEFIDREKEFSTMGNSTRSLEVAEVHVDRTDEDSLEGSIGTDKDEVVPLVATEETSVSDEPNPSNLDEGGLEKISGIDEVNDAVVSSGDGILSSSAVPVVSGLIGGVTAAAVEGSEGVVSSDNGILSASAVPMVGGLIGGITAAAIAGSAMLRKEQNSEISDEATKIEDPLAKVDVEPMHDPSWEEPKLEERSYDEASQIDDSEPQKGSRKKRSIEEENESVEEKAEQQGIPTEEVDNVQIKELTPAIVVDGTDEVAVEAENQEEGDQLTESTHVNELGDGDISKRDNKQEESVTSFQGTELVEAEPTQIDISEDMVVTKPGEEVKLADANEHGNILNEPEQEQTEEPEAENDKNDGTEVNKLVAEEASAVVDEILKEATKGGEEVADGVSEAVKSIEDVAESNANAAETTADDIKQSVNDVAERIDAETKSGIDIAEGIIEATKADNEIAAAIVDVTTTDECSRAEESDKTADITKPVEDFVEGTTDEVLSENVIAELTTPKDDITEFVTPGEDLAKVSASLGQDNAELTKQRGNIAELTAAGENIVESIRTGDENDELTTPKEKDPVESTATPGEELDESSATPGEELDESNATPGEELDQSNDENESRSRSSKDSESLDDENPFISAEVKTLVQAQVPTVAEVEVEDDEDVVVPLNADIGTIEEADEGEWAAQMSLVRAAMTIQKNFRRYLQRKREIAAADKTTEPAETEAPAEVTAEEAPVPAEVTAEEAPVPAEVTAEDAPVPAEVAAEDAPVPAEALVLAEAPVPAEVTAEDAPVPAEALVPSEAPVPAEVTTVEAEESSMKSFSTDSSLSSSATKIQNNGRASDLTRRNTTIENITTHSFSETKTTEEEAAASKTRSFSTSRQAVADSEVWSTIEQELESAASTIQHGYKDYRTRQRLRREDAVQITTTASEESQDSPKRPRLLGTGEFHDVIIPDEPGQ